MTNKLPAETAVSNRGQEYYLIGELECHVCHGKFKTETELWSHLNASGHRLDGEAATPSPDTCPHKTLKRQNVGNQRWYRCPECQQKFIASDWDGKVKVGAPSPAVSPKCIHGTEVWGCEFCHERSPAVSQPPQEEK